MAISYAGPAADHQQLEWLGGGVMQVLLDGERTGGQFSMFRSSAPAGAASPAHLHTREDEIFVLLRGSAIYWVGDQRFEVGEGSVAFLPRDVPHAYRITSDADLLALSTPSGLENFFRGAGHDLRTPKPEGWSVTPQTMAKAAADNGQLILGPPLGPEDKLPTDVEAAAGLAAYVAGAGEHETLEWLGGGLMRVLLNGQHTGGQLSLFRSDASAGSASPVYVHNEEDEIIVLLSGSGIYWVGGHRYDLTAGGVVVVPRGVPMAYRITSDAEMLAVTTPGGLEDFFRMAGRDVRQPRPDGWQVSYDGLGQASRATGQTILGAPLEADQMIPAELLKA
ncbi:cupin domain-containing protein [Kribbella sp. NPDC051137]|uniref:cupin domain-containing protein n=1 Tax=Kribbella sp. NPDC051137 TaxID=3155045 RepID=UPI00342C9324